MSDVNGLRVLRHKRATGAARSARRDDSRDYRDGDTKLKFPRNHRARCQGAAFQGLATNRLPFQCQTRDFVPPLGQQRESPGR